MKDKQGREYAKLNDLKAGDKIELDSGFTCHAAGEAVVIERMDEIGFACNEGFHCLEDQADDGIHCIGVYKL